jgi:ATP-dependent DNA helicase PIF1
MHLHPEAKTGWRDSTERQLIFVGDLKQLPAILEDNTRTVLYETYDGDTFDHCRDPINR